MLLSAERENATNCKKDLNSRRVPNLDFTKEDLGLKFEFGSLEQFDSVEKMLELVDVLSNMNLDQSKKISEGPPNHNGKQSSRKNCSKRESVTKQVIKISKSNIQCRKRRTKKTKMLRRAAGIISDDDLEPDSSSESECDF